MFVIIVVKNNMSKLSFETEQITGMTQAEFNREKKIVEEVYGTIKSEDYYVNKCNSFNKFKTVRGHYNNCFSTFHKVEDKIVELQQRVVPNGEDDMDYELDNVLITNNLPY